MRPPYRQSVAQISAELGIHEVNLYNWRKSWRLQGLVEPASERYPEGWGANDKFTVVLDSAGLKATELSAYCRERGLDPQHSSGGGRHPRMATISQCSPFRRSPASSPNRKSNRSLNGSTPKTRRTSDKMLTTRLPKDTDIAKLRGKKKRKSSLSNMNQESTAEDGPKTKSEMRRE